jgi:lysylphosphatidylglycerol synthetase-like protein (DUF2156 family)
VAVVLGDPIGESPAQAWAAFDRFVRACSMSGLVPGIYQATASATTALRERGFRLVPAGREAIIDLPGFNMMGSRRANLRHTMIRAARGGIRVEWHPDGIDGDRVEELLSDLVALDAAWRSRAGPAMGFTISQFTHDSVRSPAAVAIALDAADRPVAFATFARTGADRGLVCLLYT